MCHFIYSMLSDFCIVCLGMEKNNQAWLQEEIEAMLIMYNLVNRLQINFEEIDS